MSSGYFPLTLESHHAGVVQQIIRQITDIQVEYWDLIGGLDCPEDAASDGSYLTYLSMAKELLQRCVR